MAVLDGVNALTFDVFGTVVDWRTSVSAEVETFLKRYGVRADAGMFTDRWRREGYAGGMRLVRDGELPFQTAEQLHLRHAQDPARGAGHRRARGRGGRVESRLAPAPSVVDSPGGLQRLRSRFVVSTLSNGNVDLLVDMAKFGGLPWDCVLSAQITGAFKPEPQCYQRAAELLGCESGEVMMVAAHQGDLLAAARPACAPRSCLDPRRPGRTSPST